MVNIPIIILCIVCGVIGMITYKIVDYCFHIRVHVEYVQF